MQVLQQGSKGRSLGHLGKGIDVLGEALAAITELTVRTGDIGVGVVDIAGQQHTGVHLAPISTHLFAVLTAGVEVGDLIGSKHIMHILGKFCLQWRHNSELLTYKDFSKQFVSSGEYHGLLAEVLEEGALGEKLGHIAHLMAGLLGEAFTGAGQDGGTYKHRHIREFCDKLLHERQILCSIVLCRYVDLQESNINITQVIIVTLRGVADEKFTLRVVMLQPIFKGSAYEAASNNSNVNHIFCYP